MSTFKSNTSMSTLSRLLEERSHRRIEPMKAYWKKVQQEENVRETVLQSEWEKLEKKRFKASMQLGFLNGFMGFMIGAGIGFFPGCWNGIHEKRWDVFWGSMLFTGIIGGIIGVLIGIHQGQQEN